ncbi:hypothetical protein [Streptomyces kanasensis]|uniref:hypothetical protein n=1 Tax=Streptomyces kanasensis TaxID=936756 RepID=UPI0036FD1702
MTLRVYRVRADGTADTLRERREFEAGDPPVDGLRYPPCACARCAGGEAGR